MPFATPEMIEDIEAKRKITGKTKRINRISRKGEVPNRSMIGRIKHFLYKTSNRFDHTDHRK